MSADPILRHKVRKLIQAGAVPTRPPDRMWGGPGDGTRCGICGEPVQCGELGYEAEFTHDDGSIASSHAFHVCCFAALELELYGQGKAAAEASRPRY